MREWLRDWKFWAWAVPVGLSVIGTGIYAGEQIRKVPPLEQAVQSIAQQAEAERESTCLILKLCEIAKIPPDDFLCKEAAAEDAKRELHCEED